MTTALALTSAASGLLGAVGNQGRSPAVHMRHEDTSTQAIALARDRAQTRAAARNAQQERLVALLTDPQVMGMLALFGGLYASQHIPWSENKATNAALKGVATSATVLMALGRAGVGDLTTLAVAGAAGGGSLAGDFAGSAWDVVRDPVSAGVGAGAALADAPIFQRILSWLNPWD